jgi:TolA-binding protein
MLTKEALNAEVKELREQFTKGQQQLFAAKQQVEDLTATVDRLQGALIISEKYLSLFETKADSTGAQTPTSTPNGMPVAVPTA